MKLTIQFRNGRYAVLDERGACVAACDTFAAANEAASAHGSPVRTALFANKDQTPRLPVVVDDVRLGSHARRDALRGRPTPAFVGDEAEWHAAKAAAASYCNEAGDEFYPVAVAIYRRDCGMFANKGGFVTMGGHVVFVGEDRDETDGGDRDAGDDQDERGTEPVGKEKGAAEKPSAKQAAEMTLPEIRQAHQQFRDSEDGKSWTALNPKSADRYDRAGELESQHKNAIQYAIDKGQPFNRNEAERYGLLKGKASAPVPAQREAQPQPKAFVLPPHLKAYQEAEARLAKHDWNKAPNKADMALMTSKNRYEYENWKQQEAQQEAKKAAESGGKRGVATYVTPDGRRYSADASKAEFDKSKEEAKAKGGSVEWREKAAAPKPARRDIVQDYLSEKINYGGEIATRGSVYARLQKEGHPQKLIDAYMSGAKTIQSKEKAAEPTKSTTTPYTITDARYSKGNKVVQAPGKGQFKSDIHWLAEGLGGRYVHRSHGYVMTPNRAELLDKMAKEGGWDAHVPLILTKGTRSPSTFSHPEHTKGEKVPVSKVVAHFKSKGALANEFDADAGIDLLPNEDAAPAPAPAAPSAGGARFVEAHFSQPVAPSYGGRWQPKRKAKRPLT